jgi:hypothetical protein
MMSGQSACNACLGQSGPRDTMCVGCGTHDLKIVVQNPVSNPQSMDTDQERREAGGA